MTTNPLDALLAGCPFDTPGPTAHFVPAVRECLGLLCQRFPRYAGFVRQRAGARSVTDLEHVRALPALFLPVLKNVAFDLPAAVPVTVRLTSSGTTGSPSVIPLDEVSMSRRVAAMAASYRGLDILTGDMEALAFLLDPATTRMAGSVVIDAVLRSTPQVRGVTYLARMGPAGPDFSPAQAVAAVTQAARRGPVLLVGYPALIAGAVQALTRSGTASLPLPEGSRILTGGGWKSFLPGMSVDQKEFRQLAAAFFQVPPAAVRDMFGLSECPAVFVQCASGSYHVPSFALAEAIDPETGLPVPEGEAGLLQLTVPLTTSYPLLKILTTDKAGLTQGCPCGLPAPVLVPRGRVSAARFETCAMKIGRAVA